MMRLLLDTNLLMRACHPIKHQEIKAWLEGWVQYAQNKVDVEIVVSAVADYELRRGYLAEIHRKEDERAALNRLDAYCSLLGVQQVTPRNFADAAAMWAQARRDGYSTAPERDIDWDIFIAAQAKEIQAVVVTNNQKHLTRYGVDARDWHLIPVPKGGGNA